VRNRKGDEDVGLGTRSVLKADVDVRRSAWERTGDDEDRKGKQEHAGLVRVEALRLIPDGLVARAASNRGLEAGIELE
jgi:hypothetical protein